MSLGETLNFVLYALSGIFFGIFASRYSVLSALFVKRKYQEDGIACVFSCLAQLLFLFAAFFLFPTWYTSKTPSGGFFYYSVLVYFFTKGLRQNKQYR